MYFKKGVNQKKSTHLMPRLGLLTPQAPPFRAAIADSPSPRLEFRDENPKNGSKFWGASVWLCKERETEEGEVRERKRARLLGAVRGGALFYQAKAVLPLGGLNGH